MKKETSDTVKIKINGKDRPLTENKESTHQYEIVSWKEKLKAEKEMASAKKEEDDFPWLLPEDDPVFEEDPKVIIPSKKKKILSNENVTPFQYPSKKKTNRNVGFPMKQMTTIVLLAVGIGVGFGYIALNFLSNEDMPASATPSEVVVTGDSDNTEAKDSSDQKKGDQQQTSTAASSASLQLYAVQGGIFSTKEGADTVAAEIKDKGLASTVIETDGSFAVLAGLGKEKTETSAMNEQYKQHQFQEFWGGKQLTLSISTTKTPEKWVDSITSLATLSAAVTNNQNATVDQLAKIEEQLNAIETGNDNEKKLVDKLLVATTNLKENKGWEAQQSILDVVQALQ
ncbi:SPOR domain-containing protein [Metabacillus schmidteae]|uniref:SPOR domain-containing protein n=1 Tax=Metabacillus schmidteae TaxID=2730405 RepID=UPI00158E219B|nr:SPOR domain-containing protein [Metabacillus schmidteae]